MAKVKLLTWKKDAKLARARRSNATERSLRSRWTKVLLMASNSQSMEKVIKFPMSKLEMSWLLSKSDLTKFSVEKELTCTWKKKSLF